MAYNLPLKIKKTLSEYPAGKWYLYLGKAVIQKGSRTFLNEVGGTPYSVRDTPEHLASRVESARADYLKEYKSCENKAKKMQMAELAAELKKSRTVFLGVILTEEANKIHIARVRKLNIPLQDRF